MGLWEDAQGAFNQTGLGQVTSTIQNGVTGALGNAFGGPRSVPVNANNFQDPNAEKNRLLLEQQRQMLQNRPTVPTGNQDIVRNQQMGLANTLQNRASGGAPSVAEMQLMRAMDQNKQALASQAASQRGVSAGLANRNLMRTGAQVNQQGAFDASLLRANEQMQAEQQLGGLLAQTRGQDQSMSQMQLQEQAMKDDLTQKYIQLGLGIDQASFLAQQELERTRAGIGISNNQMQAQQNAALLGAAGSAGAAFLSDERQKTEISSGSKDVKKFLKAIEAKSYNYKDSSLPGAAEGRRYGIIAQDLEKSDMGKSLVIDTPNGKMIDTNQTVGALLAAVAHLNKKIEKVGA